MVKGEAWIGRHWFLAVLTVFVVFFIIGNAVSDNGSLVNSGISGVSSENYALNQSIVLNDFKYTFTEVKTSDFVGGSLGNFIGNPVMGEEADGIFLIFDLEVENVGKKTGQISKEIYVVDSEGREFEQDSDAWVYLKDNFAFKELNPGLVKKGQIIFDVPVDISGSICIKASPYSSRCSAYVNWD